MPLAQTEINKIEEKLIQKDIYTTAEAAECLNVFSTTIINWVSKGHISCYKTPGGHRKIPKEELIRFVRSHNFHRNIKHKHRILIVEDNEDARNLCIRIFSNPKYEIKAVENGFFAGIAKEFKPHLVLLDIMLPDIDGEQVCKFIKSDPELKGTKILAVSAIIDNDRINRLFEAGIDGFIPKPYEISVLEEKVETLLTGKSRKILAPS